MSDNRASKPSRASEGDKVVSDNALPIATRKMPAQRRHLPTAGCLICPAFKLGICEAPSSIAPNYEPRAKLDKAPSKVRARSTVASAATLGDGILFICIGWAGRNYLNPYGRHILNILLPGEIATAALIYAPGSEWHIEAITDVTYRLFSRSAVREFLADNLDGYTIVESLVAEEAKRYDRKIRTLGLGTARQRVATLLLQLESRLIDRGMIMPDGSLDFPLRRQHISDSCGLTIVHVSTIVREFCCGQLISLDDRRLKILDRERLKRIQERS